MIAPATVIAQAREWVGVPWLHQGRSRHGADCLGFISAMLDEIGSPTFLDHLPHNYGRLPQGELLEELSQVTREIELQPAAILLIKFPLMQHPQHAALYTGESIVHCFEPNGCVVECGYQPPWVARVSSIWAAPLVMYQ